MGKKLKILADINKKTKAIVDVLTSDHKDKSSD